MKIKMTISLKGLVRPDDVAEGFVSYCPSLNVYSHGHTEQDAIACIEKTVTLYLETCLQRRILESVLEKAGFVAVPSNAPVPVSELEQDYIIIERLRDKNYDKTFDIEVPINLIAQEQAANLSQSAA